MNNQDKTLYYASCISAPGTLTKASFTLSEEANNKMSEFWSFKDDVGNLVSGASLCPALRHHDGEISEQLLKVVYDLSGLVAHVKGIDVEVVIAELIDKLVALKTPKHEA